MKCSACQSNEAIYKRAYEGRSLCGKCFRHSIEEKVRRTISKYEMLTPRDRVAVGVSGGKDSLSLLRVLSKIEKRFPLVQLTAVIVDEGIEGYRDESLEIATQFCKAMSVPYKLVGFRELFGVTTDEIAARKRELTPCSYCGVLRRRAINVGAKAVGATKIATAHNLDDEAQTVLLNVFHGDISRIGRVAPKICDPTGRFLPRIKPFCEIPEREIALYAYLSGISFQSVSCPHGVEAMRNDMRAILNRMEEKRPGIKYTVYKSAQRMQQLKAQEARLNACKKCGEPTPSLTCEACAMLGELLTS